MFSNYIMCTVWLSKELKVLKLEATVLTMKEERQKKNGIGESKEESCGLDWNESYQYEFVISYTYLYI